MGNRARTADVFANAEVQAAQRTLDAAQQKWVDVGIEAGLLVASLNPVGGQIADGISLARNVAGGNYGAALVDAIGFVPFGGDLIKGIFGGRRIRRAMRAANDALAAARSGLSRATTFARRRLAADEYWAAIQRRRQDIINRYPNCRTKECADRRDAELKRASNLPAGGKWVDEKGDFAPAGTGRFVPDEGSRLHNALSQHQNPVTGIPYTNGQPDLSGFPPKGWGDPNTNSVFSVEIEQALGPDKIANRTADTGAAYGAWREKHGSEFWGELDGGQWHHTGDGVTMQYVDRDVHGALSHQGSASMNTDIDF